VVEGGSGLEEWGLRQGDRHRISVSQTSATRPLRMGAVLTYRVEDDLLITDQPSSPREERTRFWFSPDGRLVLDYEGVQARYVRV
jgi:hypothetical protein